MGAKQGLGNAQKQRRRMASAIRERHCYENSGAEMEGSKRKGYVLAVSAGLNGALAAISAKLFTSMMIRYGLVIVFNVTMWGCYVKSLKELSSLQATVTNFATNFLASGFAGFLLFEEALSYKWFAGALLIVLGVLILSNSSSKKESQD